MRSAVLISVVAWSVLLCACSRKGATAAPSTPDSAAALRQAPVRQPGSQQGGPPKDVLPPVLPAERARCGLRGAPILSDIGIGDLEVGRTPSEVKHSCGIVRDAAEPAEGMPQRVLTVRIQGDTVLATVLDGLIWRISVKSPRFVTRDGLHVGSHLRGLALVKEAKFMEGEDGLYVQVPSHCGLSFGFVLTSRAPTGRQWTAERLAQLHGDAVVDKIFVTRCVH